MDVPQVDAEEALEAVRQGRAVIVDVREPEEREAASIPDSLHLPLSRLQADQASLPQGRRLILQCAVGSRSHAAAAYLRGQGLDAVNLRGGIQAWWRLGLPLESPGPSEARVHGGNQ